MTKQVQTPDYDHIWADVYGDMQHSGPVHRHMRRIVRGLLKELDYDSVLDVGCGPGHNFDLLTESHAVRRFAGIDISGQAIERARKEHPTGEFRVLDIERNRLDGQWDLVFSSLLLEHLPDDAAALRNLRAMTGRHLLVTTIAGDYERYRAWDSQMGHVRNYRVGELEAKLGDAGFVTEKVIYWGFPFYTPLGRTLQNASSMGKGKFGLGARVAAEVMNIVYAFNSHRRGDLLIALARV